MKGSVYVIRSHKTTDIYIGNTTQLLCQRMAGHRQQYKNWINEKYHYVTSFEILKYDDAYIELLEEIEFQNKQELYAREGHYIRSMECINKCIAGRSKKEWTEENIEQVKNNYKLSNTVHTCECGGKYKKYHLRDHILTKLHLNYENKIF